MSMDASAVPTGADTSRRPDGDRLSGLTATDLAALVRTGAVDAETVVAAHLERIAEADPWVRALVLVDGAAAMRTARWVDARARRGLPAGLLSGVPVVVKDNIDVRGQVTAAGSLAHDGRAASRDAEVVRRLRRAGAVVVGRANMDELAMGASTQTSAYGRTHNPHDVRRSAGGRSGGSAAAVAAHEVPLSVGTDTGGSIREPAAQCGIIGMAPSPGLVSLRGVVPFAPGLDRVGPMARTVADTALLLAVLAGRPLLAEAASCRDLRGVRVGLVAELAGARNHPALLARLDQAVAALKELGAQVVSVSAPAADRALSTYMTVTSVASVPALTPYVRTGRVGAEVARRHAWGVRLLRECPDLLEVAYGDLAILRSQMEAALDLCDVLLSPTMPTTAPLLEGYLPEELADPLAAPYTDSWTVVANLVGLPALSIPVGRSAADTMPVGAMLMAQRGADAEVLRVAAALEASGIDT